MPRLARLDASGFLHHVMGRGIEPEEILFSDADRSDFLDRLVVLVEEGTLDVYAWVLMPNHFFSCGSDHAIILLFNRNSPNNIHFEAL